MSFILKNEKWILAVVAVAATLTSLFWSLILNWIPCDFCWYERICMYPLALIYVTQLIRTSDTKLITLLLAGIGIVLSVYHYLLQVVPTMSDSTGCQSIVSCSMAEFKWFGFITPALFALIAFLLIFIVDFMGRRWSGSHSRQ